MVYGVILIVLAVIPSIEAGGFGPSDRLLHGLAYGVLGGLLWVSGLGRAGAVQRVVVAIGGAAAFGLMTEFLQLLIPYRSFELRDVVADTVGAAVVVLFGLIIPKSLWAGRKEP
ncbi:MAG: VanZ family protein [Acidobacteriota bacterium]